MADLVGDFGRKGGTIGKRGSKNRIGHYSAHKAPFEACYGRDESSWAEFSSPCKIFAESCPEAPQKGVSIFGSFWAQKSREICPGAPTIACRGLRSARAASSGSEGAETLLKSAPSDPENLLRGPESKPKLGSF